MDRAVATSCIKVLSVPVELGRSLPVDSSLEFVGVGGGRADCDCGSCPGKPSAGSAAICSGGTSANGEDLPLPAPHAGVWAGWVKVPGAGGIMAMVVRQCRPWQVVSCSMQRSCTAWCLAPTLQTRAGVGLRQPFGPLIRTHDT